MPAFFFGFGGCGRVLCGCEREFGLRLGWLLGRGVESGPLPTFAHVTKQKSFFKSSTKEYGGDLYKTRLGRQGRRPLATRQTMHLVLKSIRAKGDLSFRKPEHAQAIKRVVTKFATKTVFALSPSRTSEITSTFTSSSAISVLTRRSYAPSPLRSLRAITAAIAMAVTGRSRLKKSEGKFWDRRPFTRVIVGFRSWLGLQDYVRVNRMEGAGMAREQAEFIVRKQKKRRSG